MQNVSFFKGKGLIGLFPFFVLLMGCVTEMHTAKGLNLGKAIVLPGIRIQAYLLDRENWPAGTSLDPERQIGFSLRVKNTGDKLIRLEAKDFGYGNGSEFRTIVAGQKIPDRPFSFQFLPVVIPAGAEMEFMLFFDRLADGPTTSLSVMIEGNRQQLFF